LIAADNSTTTPTSTLISSFAKLVATFDLSGVAAGQYGIQVSTPAGQSQTLANAVEVLPPGTANLQTRLILPPVLGRHATATLYVEYSNTGTAPMPAPILTLHSTDPDGSDRPILTLDKSRLIENLWTSALPMGYSTSIQIYASG